MAAALNARDSLPSLRGRCGGSRVPAISQRGITCTIGTGPFSGRINEFVNEISTAPTNSHVMFATGATGGVWKSTDDGSPGPRGARAAHPGGHRGHGDPHDADIVYVGTGELQRVDHVEPFSVGDHALY